MRSFRGAGPTIEVQCPLLSETVLGEDRRRGRRRRSGRGRHTSIPRAASNWDAFEAFPGNASIEGVAEHRGARLSLPRDRRIADSNVGDGCVIPGIVDGERPAHAAWRRKEEARLQIHDGEIGILHKDRRTLDLGRRFGPERLEIACCSAIA